MKFLLRDLDSGLYFDNGNWTSDARIAQRFEDGESIEKIVTELGIKKADVAILEGHEVVGGFLVRISD